MLVGNGLLVVEQVITTSTPNVSVVPVSDFHAIVVISLGPITVDQKLDSFVGMSSIVSITWDKMK